MDARNNKWNESVGTEQYRMVGQERIEKKDKTLGIERRVNIVNTVLQICHIALKSIIVTTRIVIQSMNILNLPDGLIITSNTADMSYCTEVPMCNKLR